MAGIIEIAKTNRSKCRICNKNIEKDATRYGEMHLSSFSDDAQAHWFHIECAALKRPERLAPALKSYKKEFPNRKRLEAGLADAAQDRRLEKLLRAELAPSGQAKCIHCKQLVANRSMRLAVEEDSDPTMKSTVFLHLACASKWTTHDGLADRLKKFFVAIPNARCTECKAILAYVDDQLACNKCGGMFDLTTIDSKKKSATKASPKVVKAKAKATKAKAKPKAKKKR